MSKKAQIVFDTIETILIFGAGFLLLKELWGFSEGMGAWVEFDRKMRGY